jgi:hypothetical protein
VLNSFLPRAIAALLCASVLACSSGCLVTQVKWHPPAYLPPLEPDQIPRLGPHARAERVYARAVHCERRCRSGCVELYYEVACLTADAADCPSFGRARQLHEAALTKLVTAGQRFKRLDPSTGLTIRHGGQERLIPIAKHGFVWQTDDFGKLVPIGRYETNALRNKYQSRGIGLPLVVVRSSKIDRPLVRPTGVFPATLVMRTEQQTPSAIDRDESGCRLELYDPLRIETIESGGTARAIAKDLSAPLVYALQGEQFTFLNYFIYPSEIGNAGNLRLIEPYQRGKVPIVLIHGLLSDEWCWVELINELIAHPGFIEHFQILAFQYPTGNSFLLSASALREQLTSLRQQYDPNRADPQLSNMILVGHSMGGLVAKLQITSSGDRLWNSVANRPLDEICVSPSYRETLRKLFYFEPSTDIARVIFLATPHRGSNLARRPVGRLAGKLIDIPEQRRREHERLIRCNPGVFSDEVRERIPTSLDVLEPSSGLLQAISGLPTAKSVCMHSVIGNRCWALLEGKSDGVVSVSSAREPLAVSEKVVKATHGQVRGHPEAVKEILYILQDHLQKNYDWRLEPEYELKPQLTSPGIELGPI